MGFLLRILTVCPVMKTILSLLKYSIIGQQVLMQQDFQRRVIQVRLIWCEFIQKFHHWL
jgi:hypothetical protein